EQFRGKTESLQDKLIVFGGAFLGAMTFAFTDSHWFNAVESEVYALSTFMTALVVWLILKWNEADGANTHSEPWILFIAYMIGLATGIHLLNLLALPFITLIIYFRYRDFEWKSFFGITAITGLFFVFVHSGVIKGTPKIAAFININPAAVSFPLALFVIMMVLAGLLWLVMESIKNVNWKKWSELLVLSLILITIGYSSYEVIFIRSLKNPNIDENDPETTRQAVAYLEREQYGAHTYDRTQKMKESPNGHRYKNATDFFWNYQVKQMYIRYFNWQFIGRDDAKVDFSQLWGIPWLIGWLGMFFHFAKDRNRAFSVLALFFMTGFAIILYLNQPDPQPRERDYSYVGSFFAFAIWIGIGAAAILDTLTGKISNSAKRKAALAGLLALLMLILPINVLKANYHTHSRWGNYVAPDYAYNLLNSCEPNGILFTNGDNDTFPLWYLQEVENERTDVRVVNLSLLNTPWYIKQLKYNEPRIPIRMEDYRIEQLTVFPWEAREVQLPVPKELNPAGEIRWTIQPTFRGMGLRTQDLMILEILAAVKWERPVYFAVTVSDDNKIDLDDYLSMEGLTMRVNPKKVARIDEEMIYKNTTQVYRYRNLNNPKVYYEPNTMRLMQNYRTGFMQAALEFLRKGNREKGLELLNFMENAIPETVIPIGHRELDLQLGRIFYELGDSNQLIRRLERFEARPDLSRDNVMMLAQIYYYDLKDYTKTIAIMESELARYPTDPRIISFLIQIYRESGHLEKALTLLDNWNTKVPDDSQAQAMRRAILRELESRQAETERHFSP
ncbi:MAG TPA: DUF2723 domain-containing protein, partial [Candidatus Marinimicrobia bacterium]|nr:DUF2723 domain-containing protein [Candidatus Neomarinimicrobiota bacterium]